MDSISRRISERKDEVKNDLKAASLPQIIGSPGVLGGLIPPSRKESEYLKAAVGWVHACVSVIADEIASIKIRLYKVKNTQGDVEEVLKHPAIDIIHRANNFTTKFDHFWLTAQYLELTGEAPWYVEMDGRGQPLQLLLLRPDQLEVTPGKDGDIISGYKYNVNGQKITLEAEEVVFLRYPDPNRQFRGQGPLHAAARTVDLEDYSEEYNRRFFYNSARPDGVLSTENKLGRDQMATLEKKIASKYKGLGNAHKTLILEKGLKWEQMGLSQKDMEMLKLAIFTRDKILGIFRVPRTVLGITDDVNRANAEATDYVFAKRTINPKMERLIQQLNEFLLPKFAGTENMFYDYDCPVPENSAQTLEEQKAGLQFGFLTINEARALDGYDPIDGGDELRVPANFQNLGDEAAPAPKKYQKVDFSDRLKHLKSRRKEIIRQAGPTAYAMLHKMLTKAIKNKILTERATKKRMNKLAAKKGKKKALDFDHVTPEQLKFQAKQLNIADSYEKRYSLGTRRVFAVQRDQVLAKMPIKAARKKEEMDWRKFLLQPKKAKKLFADELSGLVSDMIIEQSVEAFAFVGSDKQFNESSPAVTRYLESKAFKFAFASTQLTNRLLGKSLADGISQGESIPQLRVRVEKVFKDMDKYRSERIARTETIKATNYASLESYKASGVVVGKQWLTTLDERTCEWCGPMGSPPRVLPLDDNYFHKGDTFVGLDGGKLNLNYESVDKPPLHPNCRCTLIPILGNQLPQEKP